MRLPDFSGIKEIIDDFKVKMLIHNTSSESHLDIRDQINKMPNTVIVSNEKPNKSYSFWLKPMGGSSLSDVVDEGQTENPSPYIINLDGTELSDSPLDDVNKVWLKQRNI